LDLYEALRPWPSARPADGGFQDEGWPDVLSANAPDILKLPVGIDTSLDDLEELFEETYPDLMNFFDVLTFFIDLPFSDRFPYGVGYGTVLQNRVEGIGLPILATQSFRVQHSIYMGYSTFLSDPPDASWLFGLAHEFGHRYAAYVRVGSASLGPTDLLDSAGLHWSFFCHTNGSFLGGNDLVDNGNGTFTTREGYQTYSPLDRYLMGLVAPEEVPEWFCVVDAQDFEPARPGGYTVDSGSRAGVSFRGTRVDVSVWDVITAEGPREPAADASPRCWRQGFVVVVRESGEPWDPFAISRVDALRRAWEDYLPAHTDGRFLVDTRVSGETCRRPD
jgi:hypothetical protein